MKLKAIRLTWRNGAYYVSEPNLDSCDIVLLADAQAALAEKDREIDQLRVQLAGCGVAALGWNSDPAKKGDYGWSPSYQDTLNLRRRFEALKDALNKTWEVASGECQVAMDDTQGMEWISDYLSSIFTEDEDAALAPQSAEGTEGV